MSSNPLYTPFKRKNDEYYKPIMTSILHIAQWVITKWRMNNRSNRTSSSWNRPINFDQIAMTNGRARTIVWQIFQNDVPNKSLGILIEHLFFGGCLEPSIPVIWTTRTADKYLEMISKKSNTLIVKSTINKNTNPSDRSSNKGAQKMTFYDKGG